MRLRVQLFLLFLLVWIAAFPNAAGAYSLLTHEQLIDLTWTDSIVPLLLSRYPTLTKADLEHARAYAYGGCVIQDIGYYPFGDPAFSNLTHYVRSGDFVVNLFRDAKNANELAFAVGALSHYIGDSVGHSVATNLAVPVEFPKLARKYGDDITYAQGERQHVQTEFAFDINEVQLRQFAPIHYLRHIGLQVPTDLVALAFYQTYGIREDLQGTRGKRINVRGYRFATRSFIPRVAYAVTWLRRHRRPVDDPSAELADFQSQIVAVSTGEHWEQYRAKAGIGTKSLGVLLYILPKIGPLKLADVKGPAPNTEALYIHSVMLSIETLRTLLARFTPPSSMPEGAAKASSARNAGERSGLPGITTDSRHPLPNRDLDTGRAVKPGEYPLTDTTYADLLHRVVLQKKPIPPATMSDIQAYYANPGSPIVTKKDVSRWSVVQADLLALPTIGTTNEPDPFPVYEHGEPAN